MVEDDPELVGGMSVGACPWIEQDGYFRRVVGFDQAAELLSDDRLHADFVGLVEAAGITAGPLWEVMNTSFLSMNGDEHKRLRALLAGRFTPRAVEGVRPVVRTAAHDLAAGLARRGGGEFVVDFAHPFAAVGIAGLIGFRVEDINELVEETGLGGSSSTDVHARNVEMERLRTYARSALEMRAAQPADDVLTHIVGLVDAGEFPHDVAQSFVAGVLSAGHEPTVNQLGLMVMVLSERPDVWDAVASGEVPASRVVEEVLRLRSTNRGVARLVTEPITYRGEQLRQGQQLLIGLSKVNHDPTRFPNPDEFDQDGNRSPHMAFGFGPHFCLGAALVRLQLQEALVALTDVMGCPTVIEVTIDDASSLDGPAELRIDCSSR